MVVVMQVPAQQRRHPLDVKGSTGAVFEDLFVIIFGQSYSRRFPVLSEFVGDFTQTAVPRPKCVGMIAKFFVACHICTQYHWSSLRIHGGWYIGVSINGGTRKWMVYNGRSNKMDDLGVPLLTPLFQETSIQGLCQSINKQIRGTCSHK